MGKTRIAHYYDTLDEEKAARRYIDAHQAMKEALEELMNTVKALDEDYDLIDSYQKAEEALTLANGGKPDA